jgi:phosphoribosylanthranilate isomerase
MALLGADVAQWHGDPSAGDVARVAEAGVRVWPVLRVAGDRLPPEAWALGDGAEALVLDARVPGQLGGTGVALDWAGLAADVAAWRRDRPGVRLVLAGGLRPENVRTAIALLGPEIVDVSSGIEAAPGIKDPERMQAFVHAVRGLN